VYSFMYCRGFSRWIHGHRDTAVLSPSVGRRLKEITWLQSGNIAHYIAQFIGTSVDE